MSQYYEGPPKVPLEFLTLRLAHRSLHQFLSCRAVFRPVNGSWGGVHVSSLLENCDSLYFLFCLPCLGGSVTLYPPLSYRSEKSSWFFCSAFYLLGRCGTSNLISCGNGKRSLSRDFWLAVGYCGCCIVERLDLLFSFKECWHLFCKLFMLCSEQLSFSPQLYFLNFIF